MTDPKETPVLPQAKWTLDAPEAPAETSDLEPVAASAPASTQPDGGGSRLEASSPPPPVRILEAMLFIGGAPLTAQRACESIRGLTPGQFCDLIDELSAQYRRQARPYQIRLQDQGYVLTMRPRYRAIEDRLHGLLREARLSQAAIDALALVAYRQPATKDEIDAVRGSDSGNLLRQLVRRGLIAIQRGQADQREVSYSTTRRFLELFHLRSLDDLPQTQDLERV